MVSITCSPITRLVVKASGTAKTVKTQSIEGNRKNALVLLLEDSHTDKTKSHAVSLDK